MNVIGERETKKYCDEEKGRQKNFGKGVAKESKERPIDKGQQRMPQEPADGRPDGRKSQQTDEIT